MQEEQMRQQQKKEEESVSLKEANGTMANDLANTWPGNRTLAHCFYRFRSGSDQRKEGPHMEETEGMFWRESWETEKHKQYSTRSYKKQTPLVD
ncbi:MAG: hypothetical protein TQ37_07735 [Candidatus Synechococcus spongiarum 15L]|uniref:Uncharacterized protein n=1 Tax=Candidatus Synechococcus spongiarum 15L TaxID=1608419 RepID=A0A0G8ASV3_9SYNE|nr:MAG: hypothetical protein TQ37_07735 [Candidatus Synechococcus spongiarum 15L]